MLNTTSTTSNPDVPAAETQARAGDHTLIIALTVGEPAGVGPEISLAALAKFAGEPIRLVLVGDRELLALRGSMLGLLTGRRLVDFQPERQPAANEVEVLHCPLALPSIAGQLDARNGGAVLATLDAAIEGALSGVFDAVVTAPVQKSTIADSGVPFSGHTEYFAEKTGTPRVVMMLAGQPPAAFACRPLRVALATTHLPLKDVSAAVNVEMLAQTLSIIDHDLRHCFGLTEPRILVTGLNPHAGENGYLGREEIDTIRPAIALARAAGLDVEGPYPADTLFQPKYLDHCDAVLAMYHDQGLPVLKYATFGHGINITLGLPLVRTSVDHGTALDLAGTGRADAGSMVEAIRTAAIMARNRRHAFRDHAVPQTA